MEARHLGIETIYQDLALCENLDATVNIFLGREPMKRMLGLFKQVDRTHMLEESEKVLDRLDIKIPDLSRPIRQMSGGQRQAVAIARAVYWNARLGDHGRTDRGAGRAGAAQGTRTGPDAAAARTSPSSSSATICRTSSPRLTASWSCAAAAR